MGRKLDQALSRARPKQAKGNQKRLAATARPSSPPTPARWRPSLLLGLEVPGCGVCVSTRVAVAQLQVVTLAGQGRQRRTNRHRHSSAEPRCPLAGCWPGRATACEPQTEPHREPLAPCGMRAVLALVALAAIGAVHAAAPSRCRPEVLTRVLIKLKPSMLSCAIDAHVFGGKDFHCSARCAKDMQNTMRTNDAEVACIGERG